MNKLILFLFLSFFIDAQENEISEAFVSTEYKQEEQQWVGQKLNFDIVLYSPTWFSGTPRFEIPEMADAIIFKIPGSPLPGRMDKNGKEFISQSHSFAIFTRKAGELNIPAFTVEFSIAQSGKEPLRVTTQSKVLELSTLLPSALKQKIFITCEDYTLEEQWDKNIKDGSFKVGDSLKRTITRTCRNSLAMLIPPIDVKTDKNFSVYPASPKLNNSMQRGDFSASRVEVFNYIFEKEGEIILPEIITYCWNPTTNKVAKSILKKQELKISPNPLYKNSQESIPLQEEKFNFLYLLFLSPIILILIFRKKIIQLYKFRIDQYKKSEAYEFKVLIKDFPQQSTREQFLSLDQWAKKLSLKSVAELINDFGSIELKNQYLALSSSLFSEQASPFNSSLFIKELVLARREFLKSQKQELISNKKFLGFG
ncbi:hypothetical protein PQO03_10860 [Lentisphaera profundi]|uniref:Protein BatD n=1 Tax=Lentisphaera profundi TaxID=1658616 RepID=A0ABY7VSC6_9BACT|nr:hypothetical protein [Lentisphaera profundi]WDE96209.1 hypothetical protein PQO03_10860 [Lentisphaera profundi]